MDQRFGVRGQRLRDRELGVRGQRVRGQGSGVRGLGKAGIQAGHTRSSGFQAFEFDERVRGEGSEVKQVTYR